MARDFWTIAVLDAGPELVELLGMKNVNFLTLYEMLSPTYGAIQGSLDIIKFNEDYKNAVSEIEESINRMDYYFNTALKEENKIEELRQELIDKFAIGLDLPIVRYINQSDTTPNISGTLPTPIPVDPNEFSIFEVDSSGNNVSANTSYTLTDGQQNLTLTGVVNSSGIGNELDNFIVGNVGNNKLYANGGNDSLVGGAGNDSYFVGHQADVVFESANEGVDGVTASGNFYLYANVENLILAWDAGDSYGVGNELDNLITGNAGQNLLIGWGGNDTISGGEARDALFGEDGNDRMNGDAGIDYIVAGSGNDTVDGGADADEVYGQDGDDLLIGGASFDTDILVGGDGNDTIDGAGGMGDYDLLYGNAGNDTFYVDTPADLVFEQLGEGTDTVQADIAGAGYYLYGNIENLILLGTTPFGVGNALDNVITGNDVGNWLLGDSGNDTLNGKEGDDVLFGDRPGEPAGQDIFVFDGVVGTDTIGDFHQGEDKIQLIGLYADFTTTMTHFRQVASDSALDLPDGSIIIFQGLQSSTLAASDFIFV